MAEDGKDPQTQARRSPPREPGQLREDLAHGIRRVPQAQPPNDGNLAAERQFQASTSGVTPDSPSSDGKLPQQIPMVRERRVPTDPGRAPALPARAAVGGGLPRHPRVITTPDVSSKRDNYPTGHDSRTASPAASDAERRAPHAGVRMPDSGAPAIGSEAAPAGGESSESAFQDGEFVGIGGGAERRATPARDGQEGDYAEPDGFETVPSPDDHSEQEIASAKAKEPAAPRG